MYIFSCIISTSCIGRTYRWGHAGEDVIWKCRPIGQSWDPRYGKPHTYSATSALLHLLCYIWFATYATSAMLCLSTHALLAIWRLAWIDLIGSEPPMSWTPCTPTSLPSMSVVHCSCRTAYKSVWSSTGRAEWLSFSGEARLEEKSGRKSYPAPTFPSDFPEMWAQIISKGNNVSPDYFKWKTQGKCFSSVKAKSLAGIGWGDAREEMWRGEGERDWRGWK